jgi:hypothetical protein
METSLAVTMAAMMVEQRVGMLAAVKAVQWAA